MVRLFSLSLLNAKIEIVTYSSERITIFISLTLLSNLYIT